MYVPLRYSTHLSEGEVRGDSGVVDSVHGTTSSSVQQQVVRSYDVRLRCAAYDSVTIVHDLCEITVFVVVAVIASHVTQVQPYTLSTRRKNNKNLAIANRSRVSCAHNTSTASISNPVTVKSRLRVTQVHRKRNHWIDHTRLNISRVI